MFERYVAVVERNQVQEFEVHSMASGLKGWFHNIASPLDGSVAVWFADVSGRKETEQALREADRRKDEFLATLAHELRNPLAPIRQAAMIAGIATATEAQKRWSHSVIERQVQHMSLLLDDLLDVSRITRGRLELRKQRTDLASVVSVALEAARPMIESKKHELVVDLPKDTVYIDADPLRLAQILSNLLTNAAKYTDVRGAIRLHASSQDGELVITVADNGIGIAREDMPNIFNMFSQVKSAQERSEGGLGIGLALTKGLVELHGGSVRVASEGAGKGSTFTVRLPIVAAAGSEQPSEGARRSPQLHLSRRILVADDNQDAADSLAMVLRAEGHEVIVAHDGERAYEAFVNHAPDVLLLDIGMPRLSGYEVAKRVRAVNKAPLLIAITGWGLESDKARALAAGFDHHLTKPVDYKVLKELLQPRQATARPRGAASSH
jgi:signal transduction histidine kinase/ActR/RegA family two-component response regulator